MLFAVLPDFKTVFVDVEACDLGKLHAQGLVPGDRIKKYPLTGNDEVAARRLSQLVVFHDVPARLPATVMDRVAAENLLGPCSPFYSASFL
jgi:hypothetical protein